MNSKTHVTPTLKRNEKQFELAGNSSYWGNFSEILIKGKEIWVQLAGNLSYLSSSYQGFTVICVSKLMSF